MLLERYKMGEWKLAPEMTSLLTEKQAAEILQVSTRTLQSWRMTGEGPKHLVMGARLVRYPQDELEKWLKKSRKPAKKRKELLNNKHGK